MGDEVGKAEENGGVRALRCWAAEAVGRARALLPASGTAGEPSRAHDRSVDELDAAELPLPPDTLRQPRQIRDLHGGPSADGVAELFGSLLPDTGPPGDAHLRRMLTDPPRTAPRGAGVAPGAGESTAMVPEIGVGPGALPTLSEADSASLERYLDAADARARNRDDQRAERAREEALSALCDGAYQVFVHVLAGPAEHLPGAAAERRTPRVVPVPRGRLGIVPWHAARFPADERYDYLCQALVISYAASGGRFLRTVRRAPRDPIPAPALLADPSLALPYAEEVLEPRDARCPGARLFGEFGGLPPDSVPAGTPDELLAVLARDHAMVHPATHGTAGTRPTESAPHRAPADGWEAADGEEVGRPTVTRLLDRPRPAERAAPDGPLPVPGARATDLGTRDHAEALTLTTASVSGGARDVVGSRWTTRERASALPTAVFHHRLRAGCGPVDGPRAARLWMLDPDRRDPGLLSESRRRDVGRPDLGRPARWAAFSHQGRPVRGEETA